MPSADDSRLTGSPCGTSGQPDDWVPDAEATRRRRGGDAEATRVHEIQFFRDAAKSSQEAAQRAGTQADAHAFLELAKRYEKEARRVELALSHLPNGFPL
jgi:hypothetical protein